MKIRAVFAILVISMLLTGCGSEDVASTPDTVTIVSETADLTDYGLEASAYIQQITPRAFYEHISAGGSGAFFMSTSSCDYCIIAMDLLVQAAEETGVTVYYIDVDDQYHPFSEYSEDIVAFLDSVLFHTDDGTVEVYLPHLFTVVDGEVADSHIGLMSYGYNGSSDDDSIIAIYSDILTE